MRPSCNIGVTVPGLSIEASEAGDQLGFSVDGGLDVNDDRVEAAESIRN